MGPGNLVSVLKCRLLLLIVVTVDRRVCPLVTRADAVTVNCRLYVHILMFNGGKCSVVS